MKRNIAAAIALEDLDAAGSKHLSRSEHVSSFGIASEGDDGRMFQQQQHVADLASLAQIDQLPLQAQPFAIVKHAELDDRNHVAIEIIGPPAAAVGRRRYSRGRPIPGREPF